MNKEQALTEVQKLILDNTNQHYDVTYQDIDCINFVGYTKSHLDWGNFKDMVDWTDKKVIDLSCFHGYFLFKAIEAGAQADSLGLDISGTVLNTTRLINTAMGGKAVFREWKGGDYVPNCDIILCLNCLHHYTANIAQALVEISKAGKQIIFEINNEQVPLIKEYFTVVKEKKSSRARRTVLLVKGVK